MPGQELFLITGAGGVVGSTGNHAARQLLERKLPVRAFVHRADRRAEELSALGAEIVVGDLRDMEAVRRTMRGVKRAYFTYPIADGLLEATTVFAAAGKEAGLEAIVNMSQMAARPDHLSPSSRQHWLAERIFDWSGIGVTHLRLPFFLETLIKFSADTIRTQSKIYLPYGQGRHAPVAGEDVGRVIVGVLLDPGSHRGKTYLLTGPRSFSMAEMAEVFSRVLGKPVQYVDIPVERWREILARKMPTYFLDHITRIAEAYQRGELDGVSDVVQQVGGSPPKSLEAFIAEHRKEFAG